MSKETIPVVVDSTEPDEVVVVVAGHPDVERHAIEDLQAGDLLLGNVGVERKTPSDFASSVMGDQRNIYDQAERLSSNVRYPFILLEGTVRDFEDLQHTKMPANALRGAMASVTIRTGVPVLPVDDLSMLVDVAVRLGRKSVEKPGSEFVKGSSSTEDDETTRILAAIDDIGPVRARRIAEEYGSVRAVCMASESDLAQIEGIGRETVGRLQDALSGL